MKTNKLLMALLLIAAMAAGVSVWADQTNDPQNPPPFNPKMALSGISGDQHYLYVMEAGKILQYELSSMKLAKSVDLPELPPPPGAPPKAGPPSKECDKGEHHHHPPGGPPQGLWTTGNYLYALAGPVVYRYSLPDLKLDLTQELPKPELPAAPGK